MAGFSELATRIETLSSRAAGVREDARLLVEIEDVLAEGYIEALKGEAKSRRLAERLERLVAMVEEPGTAVEIRSLALERRSLDARIGELRAQLAVMRKHFIRLGGGHTARR
jgi:uncharacterized coiled-coil protein SlyX